MKKIKAIIFEDYSYPFYHRISEIAGVLLFIAYFFLILFDIFPLAVDLPLQKMLIFVLAIPVVAYVAADFASGMVHFLCDNFGSPETPYVGPSFIKSFREHHTDPKGITRHDFLEVNGSNCIISVPVLMLCYHAANYQNSVLSLAFAVFLLFFLLFIFLTNQFHKWAHEENPPGFVKTLQKANLILPASHHSVHHTPPYDKYYCITCGWLNPVLNKIKFFETTGKLLRWIFRIRKGNDCPSPALP